MTNMAMNAAAVYGMCCGIFLSFCMKDPFAGRATCSDSSGLTFIYLSLFYYSLYTYLYNPDRKPSIVSANFDCRLSVRSRTSLFAGEKSSSPSPLASVFFAASLFLDWSPILGQKNKQPSGTGLYQREEKERLAKERQIQTAILNIKKQFGKNAILKGLNYEEGATAKERNEQIGGHKA